MKTEAQQRGLRYSAAWDWGHHLEAVRISGRGAHGILDHLCPAELYLRDGQMLHTLLLADDASILADLYLCCDDEAFILLAEAAPAVDLMQHISAQMPPGSEATWVKLTPEHRWLSLHGPYAWEVLSSLVGARAVGLPYLTFFHHGSWTCFRAGKTGEYGYDILVPGEDVAALQERLLGMGPAFDLLEVEQEALDQCALENRFFNIRREGRLAATPIELQLQWRVSYRKDYVGAHALAQRRRRGPHERLTTLLAQKPLMVGDPLRCGDRRIGTVVNAGFSSVRGDWIAAAMIEAPWAHAGIDGYAVHGNSGPVPVRTVSPPVLNNRSMYVNPQIHSYHTRDEDTFPPVVLDGWP